jgi:hypothetical protein
LISLIEEKKNNEDTEYNLMKTFENKLADLHPKFLRAIKETYPLAVLGSLCMAIAAFTQSNFPEATSYALTGASFFLVGFVCSLLFKVWSFYYLSFFTYLSTTLGIVMMFFVIAEFGKSITLVNNIPLFFMTVIGLVIMSITFLSMGKIYRSHKSNSILLCGYLISVIGVISIVLGPVIAVAYLFNIEEAILNLVGSGLTALIISGFGVIAIEIPLERCERLHVKKLVT